MKRVMPIVFVLAMLAILILPAWYLYNNPSMLAVYEPVATGASATGNLPSMLATPSDTPMLAIVTPSMLAVSPETSVLATSVTITVDSVNLRDGVGKATGQYLYRGDQVQVTWDDAGNFGVILLPAEFSGYRVWRGCTSDAGNLGCESK